MADQDFNINIRTTADLAGARQAESTLSDLQRRAAQIGPGGALAERDAAAGAAVASAGGVDPLLGKFEHGFERIAIHAAGIGLLLGAIEDIKRFAEELDKIADALDKQGDALVKNVQLMSQQARFATTEADVIKVAETGLRGQAEQHKVVEQLLQKELTWYEKAWDAIGKIGELTDEVGDAQKKLNEAVAESAQLEDVQREATIGKTKEAQLLAARHAAQSFSEQIDELNEKIKQQEKLQNQVGIENIASWTAIGVVIEGYKKQLAAVIAEQERFAKSLAKSGGQDVAGKLTPGGEIGHLHQQLGELSGLKNLTPAEEKAARDAFINTTKELRDKEIQAGKDARDAQIKAQRDRYEGTNLTVRQPGESQSQYNAELLAAIRDLAAAWK